MSSDKDISELFAAKYNQLYNSVSYDINELSNIQHELNKKLSINVCDGHYDTISLKDVSEAIDGLKSFKRDGSLDLYTDNFIHCSEVVKVICDLMGQNQSHVAIFSYGVKYTSF